MIGANLECYSEKFGIAFQICTFKLDSAYMPCHNAFSMSDSAKQTMERSMVAELQHYTRAFPCVLVTGARQVGKSTLLRRYLPEGMEYLTLDSLKTAAEAKNDPEGFLEQHPAPLCIDEIQYVPELFRAIKARVDADRRAGMYWLTGSQRFHLMQGVSESLAGRIGIFELHSFSQREAAGRGAEQPPLFTLENLPQLMQNAPVCDRETLIRRMHRGGYPELLTNAELTEDIFFSSYMKSYIERHVQTLTQVADNNAFFRFMRSAAAHTGQQVNYSSLGTDAGVTSKTAKAWLGLLATSGIITMVEPYSTTTSKRLVKSPKLYFMDTGLACWLQGLDTPEALARSPFLGAMAETWAFGQLWRNSTDRGKRPRICYYRDSKGAEVDFLLEHGGALTPVEVKWSTAPVVADLKAATGIPKGLLPLTPGIVLHAGTELYHLGHGCFAYPLSAL